MSTQTKTKILIFIDWFYPGYKAGGPIRSVANMIDHLSDRYEFWVVTRNTDYLETIPYPKIKSDEWLEVSENKNIIYLSKEATNVKQIKTIIKETDFDIIYINGTFSFYFSLLPLFVANSFVSKKIIVANRGMLSIHSLKIKKFKKQLFLLLVKLFSFYKKTVFHVNSDMEANELEQFKLNPKSIFKAPNLHRKINAKQELRNKQQGILHLASIARISPEKNTLYAIEILAEYKYTGKIIFDLYGSISDINYWQKCKEIIQTLPNNIIVNHKGTIDNAHIINTLANYDFMYLPSTGENYGHSIVESFFASCPVIISNQTPWLNLESTNAGWDIPLQDRSTFSKRIQQAINLNSQEYHKMQEAAYQYINTQIDTKKIISLYDDLFKIDID